MAAGRHRNMGKRADITGLVLVIGWGDRERQRGSYAIRSSFAAPKTLLHFADQLGSRCQHI